MNQHPLTLTLPSGWTDADVEAVLGWVAELREFSHSDSLPDAPPDISESSNAGVVAAALVLRDLAVQGWKLELLDGDKISVSPTITLDDSTAEKNRVRAQELIKRNEQLATSSVRTFVARMEQPREHSGELVSIFSLMRDGDELATSIRALGTSTTGPEQLRSVIDPYVTVVNSSDRCPHTGLRLLDIWRYFRHTWSNQYQSTPGRAMQILVRDRSVPFHPVIGIASLGSPVIQIADRDTWIGWQPEMVLEGFASDPTDEKADWVKKRLVRRRDEIYLIDLIAEGLYSPKLWIQPEDSGIEGLEKEAERCKESHYRNAKQAQFGPVDPHDPDGWAVRSQTELFKSRRCGELAKLLRSKAALREFLEPQPSGSGLREALQSPDARRALGQVIRRAKSDTVGTEIADLTVCGAIPPYNELIGGKLVAMLSVSPTVVRAYKERYQDHAGNIASSIAGRPIQRRSNLVFVGTTSLYGSGSSQYNRLRMDPEVLGSAEPIRYQKLGRTRSFGSSHLASDTTRALASLVEQDRNGARVNSIFGEGVNPAMRKIRQGLGVLGWPSDRLLQHGRQRILYGVPLISNLTPYLLGMEDEPDYLFPLDMPDDTKRISEWWFKRWLSRRCTNPEVLERLRQNTLRLPVSHGARIRLPSIDSETEIQQELFSDSTSQPGSF